MSEAAKEAEEKIELNPSVDVQESIIKSDRLKKQKKPSIQVGIFSTWCKSCGICVAFCPTGTLAKDEAGNPYVKDIGKCIRCGWCEIRCPDFAITVGQKNKKKAEGKGEEAESEERTVAAGQ